MVKGGMRMDDMIGIIIAVIVWGVFGSITRNAKKQRQAQPGRPNTPPKKQTTLGGGWAGMLGVPADQMPSSLREVMEKIETAFEPAKPAPQAKPAPVIQPAQPERLAPALRTMTREMDSYVSTEGVDACHDTLFSTPPTGFGVEGADDCHDYMLPAAYQRKEEEEPAESRALPDWSLRLDAQSLVQGVVLAEILTRPAQRGRGTPWRR